MRNCFPIKKGSVRRAAAWAVLGFYLLLGCFATASPGEDTPPDPPPEATAKAKDFLKKITDAQRKRLDEKMDKLISDVVTATKLGEEGSQTLTTAARKAEDAATAELTAAMLKGFAKEYQAHPTEVMESFNHTEIIDLAAREDLPEGPEVQYTHAPDQPVWKNALERTLTPEQATAWKSSRLKPDNSEVVKAINAYLDKQTEVSRKRIGGPMLSSVNNMVSTLALPKDRADVLTALANKAIDASMAAGRKTTAEALLKYDAATRDRIIKNGGGFSADANHDAPEEQAAWKDGLATLLTDDERARLKTAAEAHRTRRTQAFARLMIHLLDAKIAFSPAQRTQLQGVAEKLVASQSSFFPDRQNTYFRYDQATFYKAAKAAKADDVRPLLDDIQWKHWQALGNDSDLDDDDSSNVPPVKAGQSPTPPPEPEDMEAAVAAYLVTIGDRQRRRNSATMTLEVEDATRAGQLPNPAAEHLRAAALGAAEAATGGWLDQTESNLRGELQGATPENVRQKIAGMSRYSFSRPDPEGNPYWKQAVNSEMNEEQRKNWQAQRDEREHYGTAAVAAFIGAELDRKLAFIPAQSDRLTAALAKVFQDYGPDIRSNFAYYNNLWYLQSYTLFVPMHALPDKELKDIFSPTQFESWTGSQECNYSASYWDNIRESHERRMKEKKSL